MKPFSVRALVGTDHPTMRVPCATVGNCPQATEISVGHSRHDHVRAAEDELDEAIRDLKTLAALAKDAGQIESAFDYTRRALAASRSRTPAHKDRLAREHLAAVEASLDSGVDHVQLEGRRAAQRGHG